MKHQPLEDRVTTYNKGYDPELEVVLSSCFDVLVEHAPHLIDTLSGYWHSCSRQLLLAKTETHKPQSIYRIYEMGNGRRVKGQGNFIRIEKGFVFETFDVQIDRPGIEKCRFLTWEEKRRTRIKIETMRWRAGA